MDNPLSLMYSWQAVAVAIACVGITKLVKTIIEVAFRAKAKSLAAGDKAKIEVAATKMGHRTKAETKKAKSEDHFYAYLMRKNSVWLNRFLLPLAPIFIGAIIAVVIPVIPEDLLAYLDANVEGGFGQLSLRALWGGACGQFADYIFSKVKHFFEDFAAKNSGDHDLPPGAEVVE